MATGKKDISQEKSGDSEKRTEVVPFAFDLKQMYSFDPKEAVPDISLIRYSNLAYINVSHRDVHIDFLEMPGIKKEGKMYIPGTRIYMTHAAAQRLVQALGAILEDLAAKGIMEKYQEKEQ
ncbi:MAG: DUF3467 domain-containing protein [Methanophagales archaeon]|nr:DUF3467 domain-containing protein [Methanophagales archaeon]